MKAIVRSSKCVPTGTLLHSSSSVFTVRNSVLSETCYHQDNDIKSPDVVLLNTHFHAQEVTRGPTLFKMWMAPSACRSLFIPTYPLKHYTYDVWCEDNPKKSAPACALLQDTYAISDAFTF